MKVDLAIRELHRSEKHLAHVLMTMSDEHKTDHEVFYLARDMAGWSEQHVAELADAGQRYGLDLGAETEDDTGPMATLRQKASEMVGRKSSPALLLLADLRHLYREASGASLDWELLAQGAQAVKNPELLALSKRCHPETLRQVRWANAMLKVLSPQVLAS